MSVLQKFKPGVSKIWLLFLAGLLWSVVGLMLCRLAYQWLAAGQWRWAEATGLLGIVLAFVAHRFCFSRLAFKNINRLCMLEEKTCIFAFQKWKSYLLVGVMVGLGFELRHSLIPKPYLAILYITIGGALLLSSLHYYGCLWRMVVRKGSCLPPGKGL
jgi:hypothetical protein